MRRVSDDFTLQDAGTFLQKARKVLFKDAEVIQEDQSKLDGRAAYHCLYKFKHPKAKKATIQRILALVVDGMLVSLTASRTAGKDAELDQTLAVMIDKFKFM
jgi:hypothetical protein